MFRNSMRYCSQCGASLKKAIPDGDNRLRDVCTECPMVHYQNPRIVTGCLPVFEDKVLLCKRAIEPRKGYWTLPGGFMELGESIEEGAARETMEEAGATVAIESLYTFFNVIHVGQISVFFLATMHSQAFEAGIESEEVRLFSEEEIPWENLAFNTIHKTLKYYFSDRKTGQYPMRIRDIVFPVQASSSKKSDIDSKL